MNELLGLLFSTPRAVSFFMTVGTKMDGLIVVFSSQKVVELHRTVQSLFDEEEALLNLHMNVIQVGRGVLCY